MGRPEDIERYYEELVDRPRESWKPWLDEHCQDPDVAREVLELLAGTERAEAFLPRGGFVIEGLTDDLDEPLEEAPPLGVGDQIGSYRIEGELGRGGMGRVLLARDTAVDRLVALKMLHPGMASATTLARLQVEARALGRLDHPSIVRVHRAEVVERHYLVEMEYVEGRTLADLMAAGRPGAAGDDAGDRDGRTDELRMLARIVAEVADALEHAHSRDIVHRDVKPSNILIDTAGRARLTDFGIARLHDVERITATDVLPGTCFYISPEQARAQEPVDGRSDVFSLGVVLYEALAREVPFQGRTVAEVIGAVTLQDPEPLLALDPGLPVDLATICHKAIEKRREDRYGSAAQMAADLRAWRAGRPVMARPPSWARRTREWVRRHRVASLVAALALVGGLLGLLLYQQARDHEAATFGLSVDALGEAPEAWLRSLDADGHFGPYRALGETPVDLRLQPGVHEVLAVDGRGSHARSVIIERDPAARVAITLRPASEACPDGMLTIPAGRHALGALRTDEDRVGAYSVELPAFHIDRTEVSNGEYRLFVLDTGHEPPAYWPDPYDPGLDALPVIGVRPRDAEAYARWRGCRLPTADEWEAAARWQAPEREFAWGDAPRPADTVTSGAALPQGADLASHCLAMLRPVDGAPASRTPAGLAHMSSNVEEFTATWHVPKQAVVIKGDSWWTVRGLRGFSGEGFGPMHAYSPVAGFRCARSVTDLPPGMDES